MLPQQAYNVIPRAGVVAGAWTLILPSDEIIERNVVGSRRALTESAGFSKACWIGEGASQPASDNIRNAAILQPRIHSCLHALEAVIANPVGRRDWEPIGQRRLRPVHDETAAFLASGDDRREAFGVRSAWVTRHFGLSEGFEHIRQAVMPVGMCVQDVPADELGGRVAKGDIVGADRDHEFRIMETGLHDVADRQLLLHAMLGDTVREDDDLLNRLGAKNAVDLVPKIIAAA